MRPIARTLASTLLAAVVVAFVAMPALADAPAAVDDHYSTAEDTPLVVDASLGVLWNDTDSESANLTVQLGQNAQNGTLTLDPSGSFTYTPAGDYNGSDSFTYQALDGPDGSNVATVTIDVTPVNDPPVANDDAITTAEDTPVPIAVLSNDTDVDGDQLSVQSVTDPAHGTATNDGDGTVTYSPAADFHGAGSFDYTVSDGHGGTDVGSVSVVVSAVNDAPVANPDAYLTPHDKQLSVAAADGVLFNDTDADGDGLNAVPGTDPAHGALTLHSNGGFDYTPNNGFVGTDTFTYTAFDGTADSDPATVTIQVTDQAPTVQGQVDELDEDTTLHVDSSDGLLKGASDADDDAGTLTSTVVDQPDHGTVDTQPDGSFDYTPDANYNGPDSFTFRASDGITSGPPATVDLTIDPVEDPPSAADDTVTTAEDTPVLIPVLSNDSDPDLTDSLSVDLTGFSASHGTITVDGSGVQYTPAHDFNGLDGFDYTVDDGHGGTAVGHVTVHVTPVDDAPVGVADSYQFTTSPLTTTAANGVLANDTDVDGPFRHAVLVTRPALGTLVFHPVDGSFVYTPNANVCQRNDSFTYRVSDGTLQSAPVTVSLQVRIARRPASLTLTRSATPVDYLSPVTMTAHLSAFSPGARITLGRTPLGGTAVAAGVKSPDAHGNATFVISGLTKRNTFTAASTDNCHVAAASPGSIVDVRAKVIGTLAGGHLAHGVRTYVNVNPLYTTKVTPAHPGAAVRWQWQVKQHGVWKDYFTPTVTLGSNSTVAFGLTGWAPNALNRIRAVGPYDGSGHHLLDNAPGGSTWLYFVVKPA
jgi:VCBS repeat-containing protein